MARGRVWSGVAAQRGGLVDEFGGLEAAIEIARARAGIKDGERHELVLYPARGILAGIRTMTASAQVPWGSDSRRRRSECRGDGRRRCWVCWCAAARCCSARFSDPRVRAATFSG